jgi:hypothetical protein
MDAYITGRQGRQPNASYRSVGLANFVKNVTIFEVSSTGRQGRQPMGATAPLITQHCQKVNDLSG